MNRTALTSITIAALSIFNSACAQNADHLALCARGMEYVAPQLNPIGSFFKEMSQNLDKSNDANMAAAQNLIGAFYNYKLSNARVLSYDKDTGNLLCEADGVSPLLTENIKYRMMPTADGLIIVRYIPEERN